MWRAFAVINPAQIVLVEAEVWPNLVAFAHSRRIPSALVNARLSPRSERRFRQFRFFVAPFFCLLDLVCVQEPEDTERWTNLGVRHDRIQVVGSIKYDPEQILLDPSVADRALRDLKIDAARPVLLGGSTHRGEEEILGRIFADLREKSPDLFLIIAPRHAERGSEVGRALERLGLRVARRSQACAVQGPIDCLLLDSTGELRNWYGTATVVFIGKSLTKQSRGGQNPVEPIIAGRPIIFGPHMENFAALARSIVAHRGAIQIDSEPGLKNAIVDLLRDAALREKLVTNARATLDVHHGATMRTARLIVDLQRN
jgi:3-deoxy-D-manno-octulosonic-acid transferase